MKKLSLLFIATLFLAGCTKSVDQLARSFATKVSASANTLSSKFLKYTIYKGKQYCDKSAIEAVKYEKLAFTVKFDSSAIYKTANPKNQDDINKLYGFSDNNKAHHIYSARFGWRWSKNALRLFAYIYNNSVRSSKELGTVAIGSENKCSIQVADSIYIFTLNNKTTTMPRKSKTAKGQGYRLFPYFGGDELAPHDIIIWIKE